MIENIFPIKIYKTNFSEGLEELKSILIPKLEPIFEKTKLNNQGSMRGGLCSYNVARDLHHWPELKQYVSFLKTHISLYWNELGYGDTPKITETWANQYPPDSFIDTHNHSPIPITISFYLQKSKDSGNIRFTDPNEAVLKYQPFAGLASRDNYHNMFVREIEVVEGDVVMFPGWINHATSINNSTEDRIIIGTNVMI